MARRAGTRRSLRRAEESLKAVPAPSRAVPMEVLDITVQRKREAKDKLSSQELARRIAGLAAEKKGEAILILDLRELSSACDFFVLASGSSEVQVKAISEHIDETLSNESIRPWHIEGRTHRRWILMDYVDVVVHLFHHETRDFYRLENLWADAPREEVAPDLGLAIRRDRASSGSESVAPSEETAGSRPEAAHASPPEDTEKPARRVPDEKLRTDDVREEE